MAAPAYHGRTHAPGGTDPIPGGGHGPWITLSLLNGYTGTLEYRHAPGSPGADQWELEWRGHIDGPSDTYCGTLPSADRPPSDKYGITEGEDADTSEGMVVEWYIEASTGNVFITYPVGGGGGGGAPSGTAGGALDGTYPNPGLAASVAGSGLAETSDVLSVNVDSSTIEISSDTLRVKDGGITFAKLASGAQPGWVLLDTKSGSSASFDFTSISGSYSALKMICFLRTDASVARATVLMTWNNDSGSNYDRYAMYMNGTTASNFRQYAQTALVPGTCPGFLSDSNRLAQLEFLLWGYTATSSYRTYTGQWVNFSQSGTAGSDDVGTVGGAWNNTSNALNRITLTPSSGSWTSASIARLYGLV